MPLLVRGRNAGIDLLGAVAWAAALAAGTRALADGLPWEGGPPQVWGLAAGAVVACAVAVGASARRRAGSSPPLPASHQVR
jgi:hypothetical protein